MPGERQKLAYSYYAGDQRPKNDTVRERNALEQKRRVGRGVRMVPTVLALLAILFSVVYNTTLSSSPYIVYAGDSSPYHPKEYYQAKASEVLGSSVKNKSKLTLNTERTEAALLKEFTEFDVVKLTMPIIGRRPTLTAHVRRPALLLGSGSNTYVIDTNGKVVSSSELLSSSQKEILLRVQDQSGLKAEVGSQVLTSESVAFINEIARQLKDKKLHVSEVILPATPNEVDVRLKDVGYFIRADITGSARQQAGAYMAVKESGVTPAEYIDVRVEEKVFYK